MLVVQTFSGDNLRFNMYATIGWGKCPPRRHSYLFRWYDIWFVKPPFSCCKDIESLFLYPLSHICPSTALVSRYKDISEGLFEQMKHVPSGPFHQCRRFVPSSPWLLFLHLMAFPLLARPITLFIVCRQLNCPKVYLGFSCVSDRFLVSFAGGPAIFVGGWAIAKGVLMLLDESSQNKVPRLKIPDKIKWLIF